MCIYKMFSCTSTGCIYFNLLYYYSEFSFTSVSNCLKWFIY